MVDDSVGAVGGLRAQGFGDVAGYVLLTDYFCVVGEDGKTRERVLTGRERDALKMYPSHNGIASLHPHLRRPEGLYVRISEPLDVRAVLILNTYLKIYYYGKHKRYSRHED